MSNFIHHQCIGRIVWGSTIERVKELLSFNEKELLRSVATSSTESQEGYVINAQYELKVTEGSLDITTFEGTVINVSLINPPSDLITTISRKALLSDRVIGSCIIGINSYWGSDNNDNFQYTGFVVKNSLRQKDNYTQLDFLLLTLRDYKFNFNGTYNKKIEKRYLKGTKLDKIAQDLFGNNLKVDETAKKTLSKFTLKEDWEFTKNLNVAQKEFMKVFTNAYAGEDNLTEIYNYWKTALNDVLSSLDKNKRLLHNKNATKTENTNIIVRNKKNTKTVTGDYMYSKLFSVYEKNLNDLKKNYTLSEKQKSKFENINSKLLYASLIKDNCNNYYNAVKGYNDLRNRLLSNQANGNNSTGVSVYEEYLFVGAVLTFQYNYIQEKANVTFYVSDPISPQLTYPASAYSGNSDNMDKHPSALYFKYNFLNDFDKTLLSLRGSGLQEKPIVLTDKDILGEGVYYADGYIKLKVRPYKKYLTNRYYNIITNRVERNNFINPLSSATTFELFYYTLSWSTVEDNNSIELYLSNYNLMFEKKDYATTYG